MTSPQTPLPHLSGWDQTKQSDKIVSHDITTVLNYFKDSTHGLHGNYRDPGAPPRACSRSVEQHEITVHDVRGSESGYTLYVQGFQFLSHESKEKEFTDDNRIKRIYYPETEMLLKQVTRASQVIIFNHTVRRGPNINTRNASSTTNATKPHGPVHRVHIDVSYVGAPIRNAHHFPDEAPSLLTRRYQIINVWGPIKKVFKDPLGVADASSVRDEHLVPLQLARIPSTSPPKEGEIFAVRASSEHRWYYLRQQTPEEVLLIKCFDSETDGRARRVPHTAFVNREYEDMPERESIEVRALVFYPDNTGEEVLAM
ncbi:hypothetical protein V8F33_012785 [Rhypophila sp. PSN 637]